MKKISNKIFKYTLLVVAVIILILLLLNTVVFKTYRVTFEKNRLKAVAEEVIEKNLNEEEARELGYDYNVRVDIRPARHNKHFFETNNNNQTKDNDNDRMPKDFNGMHMERDPITDEEIKEGVFRTVYKEKMSFLTYIKEYNDKHIMVSYATNQINKYVVTVNRIFTLLSAIIFLLGLFYSYLISKKVSKPIVEINDAVKEMTKLNFSNKLNFNSGDEVEELGNNLNYLSNELENKIQELKTMNIKLKNDANKDKELLKKQNLFIANLSHELNTPLTIISTYAETLNELENDEEKKDYIETIIEENKNLSNMLERYIEEIKSSNQYNEINETAFDFDNLINRVLELFKFDTEQKSINIKYKFEPLNKKAFADEKLIEQVLKNAISNAINNTENNKNIYVDVSSIDNNFLVEIINEGAHIDDELIDKVWDVFFTTDESRNKKYGGHGLGLSIVKSILDSHNVKYGILNNNTGVKFWFELKKNI